jgi:hypothetical protein
MTSRVQQLLTPIAGETQMHPRCYPPRNYCKPLMSLRRKRRHSRNRRRHHETRPTGKWATDSDLGEVAGVRLSPDWPPMALGELEPRFRPAPSLSAEALRDLDEATRTASPSSSKLQEAHEVRRLA